MKKMNINNFPKISIVTPSYNQGKFLRETIESVLNQNYPNLEYFIIDGGSTDESVDIIREYEDRINWWVSEKDNGQVEAINKGFKKATGELLCWVNSDDVLFQGCLQEVAKNYINNYKPDLIHTNFVCINEDGIIIKLLRVPKQTQFFMRCGVWSAPAPAVFYSASLLNKVGYINPEYHVGMDLDIWIRMMHAGGRVCHIPKYLGAFRLHSNSKTSSVRNASNQRISENHEAKKILDAAFPKSSETKRKMWRNIRRIYQLINLNYLRSVLETMKVKGKHWEKAFKTTEEIK